MKNSTERIKANQDAVNWGHGANQVKALSMPYDPTASGIPATEVQTAIDLIAAMATAVPVAQTAFVDDTNGDDATGAVGDMEKPYKTWGAADTAVAAGTPAANKRFKFVFANGEYPENVVCRQFCDIEFGSAHINPAAGDALKLASNMSVRDGILSAPAGYCFDVGNVATAPSHVFGTQYAAGKVIKTGPAWRGVYFHDIAPLPGVFIATFCDTSEPAYLGKFYNCYLMGSITSYDTIELYGCYCTAVAWTGVGLKALGTYFNFLDGTGSLTPGPSFFGGCDFRLNFSIQYETSFVGCFFGDLIVLTHPSSDLKVSGSLGNLTIGVDFGKAEITGSNIGLVAVTDGECILTGCKAGGGMALHANSILKASGTEFIGDVTATLGAITVNGGRIGGNVSVAAAAYFGIDASTEILGAVGGTGVITDITEALRVSYDNAASGLVATEVKSAVDEVAAGSLAIYSQNAEPVLPANRPIAIWVDTDSVPANQTWLVYRRGVGDQIKVEMT